MTIRLALEDKGYQLTTATSSETAIEALHIKDFDLVITDLLDILKKAKDVSPEMMVIILTSNYKVSLVIKALQLDADDYIIKPITLIELWHRVAHCLEKLELKRRNSRSELQEDALNGNILNMFKIMSHDIRGSLVSISATLKLLSRGYYGRMDEGVANSLEELLSKTICLIGTTEEHMSRSFSINGDLETESGALDLMRDIINPVLEELSLELKEHRIRIDHHFDSMSDQGIPMKANRIWLKTVFRNLLKNAIKYGGNECTIGIGFEDHGSSYRFNVYNSGRPIPEEYRDKLFSKFMRFGNNGNGVGSNNGLGLGLYLTKRIIQKHGGEIWYEAKEDGSNFVFTLQSGLAFSMDSLPPIKPAQYRLAAADL
jgi:signal transduction histidine kinase